MQLPSHLVVVIILSRFRYRGGVQVETGTGAASLRRVLPCHYEDRVFPALVSSVLKRDHMRVGHLHISKLLEGHHHLLLRGGVLTKFRVICETACVRLVDPGEETQVPVVFILVHQLNGRQTANTCGCVVFQGEGCH